MKYVYVRLTMWIVITLMLAGFGCSARIYEYTSRPVSKTIETQIFSAGFTPAREDAGYFLSFMLDIENKSDVSCSSRKIRSPIL